MSLHQRPFDLIAVDDIARDIGGGLTEGDAEAGGEVGAVDLAEWRSRVERCINVGSIPRETCYFYEAAAPQMLRKVPPGEGSIVRQSMKSTTSTSRDVTTFSTLREVTKRMF
jgi:hypothetical protein